MSDQRPLERPRVVIRKLATGVPGLDEVLGGGIPEYSFNLIAGAPGTGKTTLAQQMLFANATADRPGIFFTVLGEPPVKMLRYQQQFHFFDPARVGRDVHFVNLSQDVLHESLDVVLDRITSEVERHAPGMVVVDSFRTVVRTTQTPGVSELDLQYFVQRLALRLTSWETTSFLIGEFAEGESRNPVFTVADGVIWLINEVERNSTVRKLRVSRNRGQAAMPGLQTFRVSDTGLEVFPRLGQPAAHRPRAVDTRHQTGIAALDEMMGGGIPIGDSLLVSGPTGCGKTILATQFVAEGVARGECSVIAVFEEHPDRYVERARSLGFDLGEMVARGVLDIMYLRPLDLSVDETLHGIQERVERLGATRVVIDSLSGFEVALAPTFRQDFRESLYRLVQALSALGVTVISTVEVAESGDYLRFAPFNISFLADDIVAMRYVEMEGELRKVLSVVKMRASNHSRALRAYEVTPTGIELGEELRGYRGIITGVPERHRDRDGEAASRLTTTEALVLEALLRLGETGEEAVANETGLTAEQVRFALHGLLAVRYVRSLESDDRTLYRASSHSME